MLAPHKNYSDWRMEVLGARYPIARAAQWMEHYGHTELSLRLSALHDEIQKVAEAMAVLEERAFDYEHGEVGSE